MLTKTDGLREVIDLGLQSDDLREILDEEQSYALVLNGSLLKFLKLRKFLRELGVYIVYHRISPQHLYIWTSPPPIEEEAEAS